MVIKDKKTDVANKRRMWKKKRINLKAAAIAAFALTTFFTTKNRVFAQIVNPTGANQLCELEDVLANIIQVSVSLAAIALFVMLVFGGIRYLTSGGDPKSTQQAKSTLTYAIAGFALLIVAWFVLLFIEIFTGVQVTQFTIFECS